MKVEIEIPQSSIILNGELVIPENPIGLVLFSHGSGSGRLSPRNIFVSKMLNDRRIGTLLFDLLTEKEDTIYENRFDIDLLTNRLIETTKWIMNSKEFEKLPLGYFGASTGAASALGAAAFFGNKIKAIVSRGGRPDLALNDLKNVMTPTLLIVGELDLPVIELNKRALKEIKGIKELKIVSASSHLFEEPGKLNEVARLSIAWFEKHLSS